MDALTVKYALDGPHVPLGSGAVGFLNSSAPPQTLIFQQWIREEASVQVVVGRNVP